MPTNDRPGPAREHPAEPAPANPSGAAAGQPTHPNPAEPGNTAAETPAESARPAAEHADTAAQQPTPTAIAAKPGNTAEPRGTAAAETPAMSARPAGEQPTHPAAAKHTAKSGNAPAAAEPPAQPGRLAAKHADNAARQPTPTATAAELGNTAEPRNTSAAAESSAQSARPAAEQAAESGRLAGQPPAPTGAAAEPTGAATGKHAATGPPAAERTGAGRAVAKHSAGERPAAPNPVPAEPGAAGRAGAAAAEAGFAATSAPTGGHATPTAGAPTAGHADPTAAAPTDAASTSGPADPTAAAPTPGAATSGAATQAGAVAVAERQARPGVRELIRRLRPPEEGDFHSEAHHRSVTSRVGLWLGIAFSVCFVTGLISHGIQHPPSWFVWPSRPVSLYQLTQGTHVITGIAAIPLLLAKLWSVYPKLFSKPVVRSPIHAIERGSILVLSGSAIFELVSGLFNVFQNYPWPFYFPTVHYAVAWLAIGSILVHVAVKLPIIRAGLGEKPAAEPTTDADRPFGLTRQGFLRTTWLTVGVATVVTAGSTVPFLRGVSALATRSLTGPQGLPVNRTAANADVHKGATDPAWRLEIVAPASIHRFSLADLRAMPQTTADLPIACVEGWSASASWTGVPVADLLRAVGSPPGTPVRVTSLERGSIYGSSTLPGEHTKDPLTLLALRVNGAELDLDHGFPCRIIAPTRPGVLQTKWVARLEVLA